MNQVQTWQDYCAVTSEPVFPSAIDGNYLRDLVRMYENLERYCDDALGHQDNLVSRIYRQPYVTRDSQSVTNLNSDLADCTDYTPGTDHERLGHFIRTRSPADYRKLASVARRRVPQNLTNAKARFIHGAASEDLEEIEQSEVLVQLLQFQMKEVEHKILDHVPVGLSETVAKLQFIASLLIEGSEMDTDYFAYQVEECARVLASTGP